MPLMGQAEYARHRGCYLRAVQNALNSGRITYADPINKKIDSEAADRDWEANTDHTHNPRRFRHNLPGREAPVHRRPDPSTEKPPAAVAEALADTVRVASTYSNARAIVEQYKARMAKLEFEKVAGDLLDRRQVEIAAFNRFRVLRDALLNLPDRVASQIASESDESAIHQFLLQELRLILGDVAEGKHG
jgi:hypothetical protein